MYLKVFFRVYINSAIVRRFNNPYEVILKTSKRAQHVQEEMVIEEKQTIVNTPVNGNRRFLDTLQEEESYSFSGNFKRTGSSKSKKNANDDFKPKWRF
ncbi:hypothetical protein GWI33_018174 [Rhynchophorus ferrugineus]|uniref:Uncharacterized protein n=1 Tax=Rhynchophorus ferrugineus TaxID=354439 RepID=A0A834M6T6_RHYFE|nr:hypothetical protein GWI33_018174 [Rhynchophorus ferrugineus]